MSDSGAEEGEPAAAEPRAGPPLPDQAEAPCVNVPDMEDIGDLAQQLAEADREAGKTLYTGFNAESCLFNAVTDACNMLSFALASQVTSQWHCLM